MYPVPTLPAYLSRAVLVIPDEQRAEVGPAAGGIGVTADHELLLPDAFELQPVPRAARDVRRLRALGDQPLPARPARLREPPLRVVAPRFAELQRRARPDRLRQPRAALEQRPISEIVAVELEQVKDAEDDRIRGHALRRGVRDPEALLEPAERRLLPVERDHLAVEQELPVSAGSATARADLGVGAGEVLGRARLEPHLAAVLARDAALTVELALEQPVVAEVATVGQRSRASARSARPSSSARRTARARDQLVWSLGRRGH